MDKQRVKRIRRLVSELNRARRTQAKKIDILCRDMAGAHEKFIKHLRRFCFTAEFYETIVGIDDLAILLNTAGSFITSQTAHANLAIMLSGSQHFDLHLTKENSDDTVDLAKLQCCFDDAIVKSICHSNRICSAEDMIQMGLAASPAMLNKISIAAIGLNNVGPALGIIVLYRSKDKPFKRAELAQIAAITPGFTKAIKAVTHARSGQIMNSPSL